MSIDHMDFMFVFEAGADTINKSKPNMKEETHPHVTFCNMITV